MKQQELIRLKKEETERLIEDLWETHKFYLAHEKQIELNVLKWVLDEPVEE